MWVCLSVCCFFFFHWHGYECLCVTVFGKYDLAAVTRDHTRSVTYYYVSQMFPCTFVNIMCGGLSSLCQLSYVDCCLLQHDNAQLHTRL